MLTGTNKRLLAALLPVVAAIVLVSSLLDLTLGRGRLVIVDGAAEALDGDALAWSKLAVQIAFSLAGLVAGGWAITHDDGPARAVRQGVKRLPIFVAGLAAAVGVFLLASLVFHGWVLLAILGLIAFIAMSCLFAGIARVAGAAERQPVLGWPLVGLAVPLLVGLARSQVHVRFPLGVLADALLVIAVLGVLVRVAVAVEREQLSARLWPGIAMVAVAVLVAAGMVVLNPYAAAQTRTHTRGPGSPVAVAWPAGQHPVIVTTAGVCDDGLCGDFTGVNGGPPTIDGFGSATVAADGTVVKTAVTGGPDEGGPFVNYARCVRAGCREAWLPVRASAKEKLDAGAGVEVAGAAAPTARCGCSPQSPPSRTATGSC